MKFNIIQSIFIILLSINSLNAQTYYGKKDFGKIEFVKDSVCTVSFAGEGLYNIIDTCYYRKNGDTLFLSSKLKTRYEVQLNNKEQPIGQGFPTLIKVYWKTGKKYELMFEYLSIYDTVNNQIVFNNDFPILDNTILVISGGYYYNRMIWKNKESRYFTIKKVKYSGLQHVFLDNFPLLIKVNKLIPIDETKNFQSWVDNGFYFPVMKKSKKEKEYKTIGYWSIGLRGLPMGFEIK